MIYFSQMRKANGNLPDFLIKKKMVQYHENECISLTTSQQLYFLQECSENETGSFQRAGETTEEKMFWSPLLLSARMW